MFSGYPHLALCTCQSSHVIQTDAADLPSLLNSETGLLKKEKPCGMFLATLQKLHT